jgi:hypothetical protein
MRPDAASTQYAEKTRPSAVALVSQIRSSATAGDDQPASGIATFQRTLFVSLQYSGSSRAEEDPSPRGPRKRGQPSSAAKTQPPARIAPASHPLCKIFML